MTKRQSSAFILWSSLTILWATLFIFKAESKAEVFFIGASATAVIGLKAFAVKRFVP